MSTPYNGNASNATGTQVTVTDPVNGDALTAASGTLPWNKLADWAQRLLDLALAIGSTAWTFTQKITFNDGILINVPTTTNRIGLEVSGNGIERAVFATGGSSDGTAIRAIGGGTNGYGIDASAGGTGSAIFGEATGSGNAVELDASAGSGTAMDIIGNVSAPAVTIAAGGSQDALDLTGKLSGGAATFTGTLTATGGIAHMTPLVVGGTGVAFLNSFAAAAQAPRYWKDALGVVHIDGGVTHPSGVSGGVAFTLPSGYRPTIKQELQARNVTTQAACDFIIETNGDVKTTIGAGDSVFFPAPTFPTF